MKRKLVSFILVLICCITTVGNVPTYVDAKEDNLIFSLDFSEYDSSTPASFKDASGNGAKFSFLVGAPAIDTFDSIKGKTKFLKMVNYNTPTHQGHGIGVNSDAIKNQDNMTISMWAKLNMSWNNTYYPHLFYAYITSGTKRNDAFLADINPPNLYYRPGKDTAGKTIVRSISETSEFSDKWVYYTFTRSYDSVNKTWKFAVYANGVKISGLFDENLSGIKLDETNLMLNIGAHFNGNYPMNGYLGSFDIYNTVLDESEIKDKYDSQKYAYMDAINSMKLTDVSVQTEDLLDVAEGKIKLYFDNYIDYETVNAICFTEADGTPLKGGAIISVDSENEKNVIIEFGRLLPNTDYKITISDELKSINGISIDPQELTYTTNDGYILNEDFEGDDYIVGSAPVSGKGITYKGTGVIDSTDGIIVAETSDGDKYLSIGSNAENEASAVYKAFDTPITDGTVVVEAKIRPSCADSSRTATSIRTSGYFGPDTNGDTPYDIAHYTYGRPYPTGSGSYNNWGDPFVDMITDDNGFYNVRYVFSKDENGFWYVQMYNLDDLSKTPLIKKYANGSPFLGTILPTSIYPQTTDEYLWDRVDISEFKIYKAIEPKTLSTNTDLFNPSDDTIIVCFNEDLDNKTLGNISLKESKTGNEIDIKFDGYIEDDREISITLNEFLKYDTEYELSFDGVKSSDGFSADSNNSLKFKTKKYDVTATSIIFKDENGNYISDIRGVKSINAYTSLTNKAEENRICSLIIALIDSDGYITNINENSFIINSNETNEYSVSLADIQPTEDSKVVVYLWDCSESCIKPITDSSKTILY